MKRLNMKRCKKCNKELKDKVSRRRGYGPECWKSVKVHDYKYVFSGIFTESKNLQSWKSTAFQEQLCVAAEEVGLKENADFVLLSINAIEDFSRDQDFGVNEVVWFARIEREYHWKCQDLGHFGIRPKEEWAYDSGVNPLKGMYAYAPIFTDGEGNMVSFTTKVVREGFGKNYLWIHETHETRYGWPGMIMPMVYEDLVSYDFKMAAPDIDFSVLEDWNGAYFMKDFHDYLFNHFDSWEQLGMNGYEQTIEGESGDYAKLLGQIIEQSESILWTRQCDHALSEVIEASFDQYLEFIIEIIPTEYDNGYFTQFVDGEMDNFNVQMYEHMQHYEVCMQDEIYRCTEEEE